MLNWTYVLQMECLDLWCQEFRYLQNEKCIPSLSSFDEALELAIFIQFVPVFNQSTDFFTEQTLDLDVFQENLLNTVSDHLPITGIKDYRIYKTTSIKDDKITIDYLLVRIILDFETFVAGDYLNDTVLKVENNTFRLLPTLYFKANFAYCTSYYIEFMCSIHSQNEYNETVTYLEKIAVVNNLTSTRKADSLLKTFTKMHICSYVQIKKSTLTMTIEESRIVIHLQESNLSLTRWEYELNDETLTICIEDFRDVYDLLLTDFQTPVTVPPKQILAFFCTCISVACLLLTTIIYLAYSELQSQPGVNNMILCVCLLCAQTIYQFGAAQTTVPSWACTVIGIACHFMWLSVMFAMNVCSIEMFYAFKKLKMIAHRFSWKSTIRYISYITLSSIVLVLINVVVSLANSNGEQSGYGGSLCYLSSSLLHMVTFLIPTAATIFVNILLFCLTVIRIKRTYIQSEINLNQQRNYFAVYARLSTLTGLTWTVGFIRIFWPLEVLEYMFIILNGSQGVIIMIAFIFTKRVWSLFKGRVDQHSKDTKESQID